MVKWWRISSLLLLCCFGISAQPQKVNFGGYVSGLYIPMGDFEGGRWMHNGLLHNRLNFKYTPDQHWSFQLELRNRAMYGTMISAADDGWMNLSWNWASGADYMINTFIDRLNVAYNTERWGVSVGRQRINWSQTLMFNPNDIFNGYSLFDFDYMERSGSDAIRLSYYPSEVAVVEVAAKLDSRRRLTAALLHRFNLNMYDWQYMVGVVRDKLITAGGGFSGEVRGVNLRGELSYFFDTHKSRSTWVAALGADYVFGNSLMLSGELLYNTQHSSDIYSVAALYGSQFSPNQLSITPWTLSTSLSYSFSPIVSGAFTAISFIDVPLFYFGPSIDCSLTDNLTLSTMIQLFAAGESFRPSTMGVGYVRLKYNF